MKVAMMQPAFLPWQGFFELIYHSDIFIVLDDFQFSIQSHHQRNRLFVNSNQVGWYTVPVLKAGKFGQTLNLTRIDESAPWRRKILERLRQNYNQASFFDAIYPAVAAWLSAPSASLAQQNLGFIQLTLDLLGWQRELRLSSNNPSSSKRSERVLELLNLCGASRYYAANGAYRYMLEDQIFPVHGIEVLFQDVQPEAYYQTGSPAVFVPRLSVLDALFNLGPESTSALITKGTSRWLHWNEMTKT